MEMPRWLAHQIALWRGYYWLPCPLCGRMYGAQEIARDDIGAIDGKPIRPSELLGDPTRPGSPKTWHMVCNRHHANEADG